MITDRLTRIFTSKPGKLVLVLGILAAVAVQVVPHMVDTKPYVEQFSKAVQANTGATLMVKGGSQLQIVPRPAILIRDISLTQPGVAHAPTASADIAEVGFDIMSLVTGAPQVNSLRVAGVVVAAEKQEGATAWGFLGLPFLKALAVFAPENPVHVEMLGGRITVADVQAGESEEISHIEVAGDVGKTTQLSGSAAYREKPYTFSASRNGNIGSTPVTLSVIADKGHAVSLKGDMDFTADDPIITAKLDISSPDIATLFHRPAADTPEPPAEEPSPLKLTADYVQNKGRITLTQIALETLKSKGTGEWSWDYAADSQQQLSLAFGELDIAAIRKVLAFMSAGANPDAHAPKMLVDKDLKLALKVTADKVLNGAGSFGATTFDGVISDGALTVNKLNLLLPGESDISLFGLLSVSDTQGLRFQGNVETRGKSLREALTVLDESAANLPALGFGAFNLRSNLFVSSELLRLSEADAQFSELSLKGGLVAYFDKRPRLEADIGLRDINFDYFRDAWRSNAAPGDGSENFLRFDRGMNFDWLKKLAASIDFTVSVKGFTFLERKGGDASFRIFAQGGELGIYNAKFNYGGDVTEGSFKLSVATEQPVITLVLNTSELNTNYFLRNPAAAITAAPVELTPSRPETINVPVTVVPELSPEEELHLKLKEEEQELHEEPVPGTEPEIDLDKILNTPLVPEEETPADTYGKEVWNRLRSFFISSAQAQETPTPAAAAEEAITVGNNRWPDALIDMTFMDGIDGNFDITVGTLIHKGRIFRNFKMLAKLESSVLSMQTLTFAYWGGSISINGTLFGGKVPGFSLGFIIASADIRQVLSALLDIDSISGRASLSGTLETSGINLKSWIEQANAKMLVSGRGVTLRGFDVASVTGAVTASRTAADVFNNVNLSIVNGIGEYSADGAINLQKGVISTPGITLNTGRIVGSVSGDFRLLPWDINLTGTFKFPELAPDNVPSMTVQWSGPVDHPKLQTDTQALEAFVSKRITGN